jgi:hypothetical protein
MLRFALALAFAIGPAAAVAQRTSARLTATPTALDLFEQDWVLMNWALKHFDRNGDILLEPGEAEAAASVFRKIADTNGDGRVTVEEYRAARALILSRDWKKRD